MNFDQATIERFIQQGYLHYPGAIPIDLINTCRNFLIDEAQIEIDNPRSWTKPVVRILGSPEKMFWDVLNHPNLLTAYDALIGPGRWKNPVQGTGSFPIRFPSTVDPGDAGWHIDGSFSVGDEFHVTLDSRERSLLLLVLYSDVTQADAPTRIRRGSHLKVPSVFGAEETTVSSNEISSRVEGLEALPLDLATGKAGDVYLCHPFLVHAANFPHTGTMPRFISQPGIAPELPSPNAPYTGLITNGKLNLDRDDGDYSPVEQAILIGLGRAR